MARPKRDQLINIVYYFQLINVLEIERQLFVQCMSVVLPTSSRLGAESVCSAQTSVPRREVSVNTVLPSEAQFKDTNLKSLSFCRLLYWRPVFETEVT